MRALLVLVAITAPMIASAQPADGSAGSAAPTAGSAAGPAAGSAAAPAAGSAAAPAAADGQVDPARVAPPAPAVDVTAARKLCETALLAPPGGDVRFVADVQSYAQGLTAQPQLIKTPEGTACIAAIGAIDEFRSATTSFADSVAAKKRDEENLAMHKQAADAIAKNEKHVIMAYAALWILAAGFLVFLWRRQQFLKSEIAQLKRDLDAATKS